MKFMSHSSYWICPSDDFVVKWSVVGCKLDKRESRKSLFIVLIVMMSQACPMSKAAVKYRSQRNNALVMLSQLSPARPEQRSWLDPGSWILDPSLQAAGSTRAVMSLLAVRQQPGWCSVRTLDQQGEPDRRRHGIRIIGSSATRLIPPKNGLFTII